MHDAIIIAFIQFGFLALPSLLAAYFSYRSSVHSENNLKATKEVVEQTNGMKTELVALTAKASKAEGVKQEKDRHEREG